MKTQGKVRNKGIHILSGLVGLLIRTDTTVNGRVDAPQGCILMHSFQSHHILIFCPMVLAFHPQTAIHGLQYFVRFPLITAPVFAYQPGNLGGHLVSAVIIS